MYSEHSEMMLRIHGIFPNDWLLTSEITKRILRVKRSEWTGTKKGVESNGYEFKR